MLRITFLVLCLACAGHGRRVQTTSEQLQGKPYESQQDKTSEDPQQALEAEVIGQQSEKVAPLKPMTRVQESRQEQESVAPEKPMSKAKELGNEEDGVATKKSMDKAEKSGQEKEREVPPESLKVQDTTLEKRNIATLPFASNPEAAFNHMSPKVDVTIRKPQSAATAPNVKDAIINSPPQPEVATIRPDASRVAHSEVVMQLVDWDSAFAELEIYKLQGGDVRNIPVKLKTDSGFPLGMWVNQQKDKYYDKSAASKFAIDRLSGNQRLKLENIGVVYRPGAGVKGVDQPLDLTTYIGYIVLLTCGICCIGVAKYNDENPYMGFN